LKVCFAFLIFGSFGYPELKKQGQRNTSEGDTHITRDLGILLLLVSPVQRFKPCPLYLYLFWISSQNKGKETSLNGIEKCSPAKSNGRDGQGKSDK